VTQIVPVSTEFFKNHFKTGQGELPKLATLKLPFLRLTNKIKPLIKKEFHNFSFIPEIMHLK
jgi:hypothetical protein